MGCEYRPRGSWPTRSSAVAFVLPFLVFVARDPAAAQFVCTTTATETTCTNSGTAPGNQSTVEVAKSVTTTNSGSVNGFIQSITTTG
ncbi:MAG TPA: hypothetical protein VK877_15495, partial [Pseudolabrys sp.]|nr:hypothetical protein [Pseudolabrys sp.]